MSNNTNNAIHRLLCEMHFQECFDDGFWANDHICSYTSKTTYKVGETDYKIVVCADYKISYMEAFLITAEERDFVAKIAELNTDYPSEICEEFGLFDVTEEIISIALW